MLVPKWFVRTGCRGPKICGGGGRWSVKMCHWDGSVCENCYCHMKTRICGYRPKFLVK